MKKSIKINLILTLCILPFVSCNTSLKEGKQNSLNSIEFENISYSSEASKTIGNLFDLQIKTCEKAISTVSEYVPAIEARELSAEIDFDDIGKLLPNDLSLLKRSISDEARNLCNETISLEDELNEIKNEYLNTLKEIEPDHSNAITVEGINTSETGYVFGDDAEVPFESIQGIITTAVLNEVADGKNISDILDSIKNDISSLNLDETDRAVVLKSTARWPKGVVNYRWGDITDEHKTLIKNAMNIWTEKTEEKIKFEELDDSGWTNFTLGINVIGCVVYNTKKLDSGIAGNSYVGCIGGKQDCNLSESLSKTQYVRTPVHELGHVLGLQHEHTRYDRDEYIEVSAENTKDSVNYGIVPLSITGWRWESRTVQIGWWRITLWYPAFWESEYSWQSDNFDFESVMLYSGLKVKADKKDQNGGNNYTLLYSMPSEKDIEMIKRMY